ncbi:hypothetical protein FS749_013883 [Ceratobasidium sp. UAMH 11750]|nr:hypothetical protein FS749_013883 [Ceratobasidium sp. UAMH 11750]
MRNNAPGIGAPLLVGQREKRDLRAGERPIKGGDPRASASEPPRPVPGPLALSPGAHRPTTSLSAPPAWWRVTALGDGAVGKTSIAVQFTLHSFTEVLIIFARSALAHVLP